MDCLRLRTLTEKSTLQFGKHSDVQIGQLLRLNETTYLRWVYFNFDMISFNELILDKIHIPIEFRILKPGKNPEKHCELTDLLAQKLSGFHKFKKEGHRRVVKRAKLMQKLADDNRRYSKAKLASKNHGH